MKKCTGENCPMQIGYDVEKCAAIEMCPYRTWPVTIADRIRSMTDNELAGVLYNFHNDYNTERLSGISTMPAEWHEIKNGLKPRGGASRERGSEWRECDGKHFAKLRQRAVDRVGRVLFLRAKDVEQAVQRTV